MDRAVLLNLFSTSGWREHFENCLEEGMDVESTSVNDGWTLIHYAMEAENLDAVSWLVNRGADINAQDNNGWTPLHCAARADVEVAQESGLPIDFRSTRFLLSIGADTGKLTNDGQTVRDIVAGYGQEVLAQFDKAIAQ